jgi:hypothetical protein
MPSDSRFIAVVPIACAALAIAGCSNSGAGASAGSRSTPVTDPQTLKVTGEPRNCISNRNVSTRPAGDSVLMFRMGSNTWFRNDLRGRCPGMRDDRTLVFRNASSQHCSLDMFTVVDSVSRANFGTCSLGQFTPVEVPRGTRF